MISDSVLPTAFGQLELICAYSLLSKFSEPKGLTAHSPNLMTVCNLDLLIATSTKWLNDVHSSHRPYVTHHVTVRANLVWLPTSLQIRGKGQSLSRSLDDWQPQISKSTLSRIYSNWCSWGSWTVVGHSILQGSRVIRQLYSSSQGSSISRDKTTQKSSASIWNWLDWVGPSPQCKEAKPQRKLLREEQLPRRSKHKLSHLEEV